jgi:magnesium-transporting ATPase (P-type)
MMAGMNIDSANKGIAWHTLEAEAALQQLGSSTKGLDTTEAAARRGQFGANRLPSKPPPGPGLIFLHQFLSPLIYILLVAAVVSLLIGELTDAGFIAAVILLNAGLGTFQEWKAEKSAAALQNLLKTTCRVHRDNNHQEIPAEDLVPGDIVLLESGSRVPADLRLLEICSLAIDESLLSGESQAVSKQTEPAAQECPLSERSCMAFAGSSVARGRGQGVVVATGLQTEVGHIAAAVASTSGTKPPLVIRMERFARQVSYLVLGFVTLLGVIAFWQGTPFNEVFLMAVALAVSSIPEGLPVAMTVALSIAMNRMARRNVIVRRLTAVEGLGSCTCIASDKTGTLTVNRQTVRNLWLPDGRNYAVTGEGYAGTGKVTTKEGSEPAKAEQDQLVRLARAGLLCNEASLKFTLGEWIHNGDTMDIALLAFAHKLGLDPEGEALAVNVLADIPFESELRYAALRMAQAGYRVLAVAEGLVDQPDTTGLSHLTIPPLTLLGLVGFIDPLRPEVPDSIAICRKAGVKVVMVTGDHPATALGIARELGLASNESELISGSELDSNQPDGALFLEQVRNARVFARVTPMQKLEIVDALNQGGHFTAVTGDGVNDAPALRRANIGVAMGTGTDVAKETASIIVTDDNFASIVAGIEEGRVAYDNIRKVVYLLISTGGAEIALFCLALFSGLPLPLVAVQLLWLNLVTNGIQDVALAFERREPGRMDHPPRPPQEGMFNRLMIQQTLVSGLTMGGLAFAAWAWLLGAGWAVDEARNSILLLMVLLQNVHVFNCRSERTSAFLVPFRRNPLLILGVIVAQSVHLLAMHLPLMQGVLGVVPVSMNNWLKLLGMAMILLLVMEGFKLLRKLTDKRTEA